MGDRELDWWDQLVEARYGAVGLVGGRVLVERTDVEKDPVTGTLHEVTERVPLGWALAYLPKEQELALKAAEAGYEDTALRCRHRDDGADPPCDDCEDAALAALLAAYRSAVPWWDDSEAGIRRRLAGRPDRRTTTARGTPLCGSCGWTQANHASGSLPVGLGLACGEYVEAG